MLKDDGLAKEIGLDKTMLLEAALKHEAGAAAITPGRAGYPLNV